MAAREREKSQPRRPSIKRPWEEEPALPEKANVWQGTILPAIDEATYRRTSLPPRGRVGPEDVVLQNRYGPDVRQGAAKRVRQEVHDYSFSPRSHLGLDGNIPREEPSHALQHQSRSPLVLPRDGRGRGVRSGDPGELAGSQSDFHASGPSLYPRCKRLTTHHETPDLYDSHEHEQKVTHAANTLSHLIAKLETVTDFAASHQHLENHSTHDPPIEKSNPKTTFDWILDRIYHVHDLADRIVQHVPNIAILRTRDRNVACNEPEDRDGLVDIMKRRIDVDLDDASTFGSDTVEGPSNARNFSRRKSTTANLLGNEDLHEMRFAHDYNSFNNPSEGPHQKPSIMDPPPAPNRQLPSPPGRSLPSPSSLNFSSPAGGSFGHTSQIGNVHHPPAGHQPSLNTILPPIASAHSSDALQAHSAALQHEVSVQKIALSSLQGEHDKLLAAFSRSQIRASALEKKHSVSDNEIITLTEEKMRLQSQVTDLERDVEELVRSRDEYRQAAVQEGSQYVEIVRKATRLEELTGEERKSWNILRMEMEGQIRALRIGRGQLEGTGVPDNIGRVIHDIDTPPVSSFDTQSGIKIEPAADIRPTTHPESLPPDHSEELREELRRLRHRCSEAEGALLAIRNESSSMEEIVQALGSVRKSISERANQLLESAPRD